MFDRILKRGRVKTAARQLASEPSTQNYILLAQAYASVGQLGEVAKVCAEGLSLFSGNTELQRLRERSISLRREDRVRDLMRVLKASPRPAIWKELCEIQLEAGQLDRAEQVAQEWFEATGDNEAMYLRSRARADRYFTDRRRDDARMALDLASECARLSPQDQRPLRLRLSIYTRCGAWNEARTSIARLLELHPGDPTLEARFRTVASLAENSKSLDQALREVERTGEFVDDVDASEGAGTSGTVRPLLQEVAAQEGVNGAFYVRGGTALVQGPKGATAERHARGVRELVLSGRSAARRLGLGNPIEVQFEGTFGCLTIQSGTSAAAALWTAELPARAHLSALAEMAGFEASSLEAEA